MREANEVSPRGADQKEAMSERHSNQKILSEARPQSGGNKKDFAIHPKLLGLQHIKHETQSNFLLTPSSAKTQFASIFMEKYIKPAMNQEKMMSYNVKNDKIFYEDGKERMRISLASEQESKDSIGLQFDCEKANNMPRIDKRISLEVNLEQPITTQRPPKYTTFVEEQKKGQK